MCYSNVAVSNGKAKSPHVLSANMQQNGQSLFTFALLFVNSPNPDPLNAYIFSFKRLKIPERHSATTLFNFKQWCAFTYLQSSIYSLLIVPHYHAYRITLGYPREIKRHRYHYHLWISQISCDAEAVSCSDTISLENTNDWSYFSKKTNPRLPSAI